MYRIGHFTVHEKYANSNVNNVKLIKTLISNILLYDLQLFLNIVDYSQIMIPFPRYGLQNTYNTKSL